MIIRSRKSKKNRQYNGQKFEDTKGVIRSRKSKNKQYNGQKKRTKGQTMIYKTLHRKLKIEKHQPKNYEPLCKGKG